MQSVINDTIAGIRGSKTTTRKTLLHFQIMALATEEIPLTELIHAVVGILREEHPGGDLHCESLA